MIHHAQTEDLSRRHAENERTRAAMVAVEETVKEAEVKRPEREKMQRLKELEDRHLQSEQRHKHVNLWARQQQHDTRRQMWREHRGKVWEEQRAKADVVQAKQIMRAVGSYVQHLFYM